MLLWDSLCTAPKPQAMIENPGEVFAGQLSSRAGAAWGASGATHLQARWQISVMSAPEKPLVYLTRRSISTSGATG